MWGMHTSVLFDYKNWHEKPDRRSLGKGGYKVSQTVLSISWSKGYSITLLTCVIPAPFSLKKKRLKQTFLKTGQSVGRGSSSFLFS